MGMKSDCLDICVENKEEYISFYEFFSVMEKDFECGVLYCEKFEN